MKRLLSRFAASERGAVTIQNVVLTMFFLAAGGIAIDVGNVLRMRTMMQAAADAGAFAGAQDLPSEADARASALEYIETNMPAATYGNIAGSLDITIGTWNPNTGTFTSGGDSNAIEVRLSRNVARGNEVGTFLMKFAGFNFWELRARAIAMTEAGCVGIVAQDRVTIGQDVRLNSGVCVYGRNGMSLGQDPFVHPDGMIGTLPPMNITTGQNPMIQESSKFTADYSATRAQNITATINAWENYGTSGYTVSVVSKLPKKNSIIPYTIYVVNGNVNIGQDYTMSDVIIAARGDINFGQDGAVRNSNDCNNGNAIGLYATGDINFGQDARLDGVDLVAGDDINIGQDVLSLSAHMEAGDDVNIAQDPNFTTCRPLFSTSGGTSLVF